jgi:hypothetical protein
LISIRFCLTARASAMSVERPRVYPHQSPLRGPSSLREFDQRKLAELITTFRTKADQSQTSSDRCGALRVWTAFVRVRRKRDTPHPVPLPPTASFARPVCRPARRRARAPQWATGCAPAHGCRHCGGARVVLQDLGRWLQDASVRGCRTGPAWLQHAPVCRSRLCPEHSSRRGHLCQ